MVTTPHVHHYDNCVLLHITTIAPLLCINTSFKLLPGRDKLPSVDRNPKPFPKPPCNIAKAYLLAYVYIFRKLRICLSDKLPECLRFVDNTGPS